MSVYGLLLIASPFALTPAPTAHVEQMQLRLGKAPEMMRVRKRTVEHPFGMLKQWMGATHFLTRKLAGVSAEVSLNVLDGEPGIAGC